MLNPFPSLLVFGFFAPTLLRIAAGVIFTYLAYKHYQNREEISHTHFPVIGRGSWITWLSIIVEAVVAIGLFFGSHTQYAALVGAILSLKYVFWGGRYPSFFVLTRGTALLVLVICLSLLVTGAGALAYDLPL